MSCSQSPIRERDAYVSLKEMSTTSPSKHPEPEAEELSNKEGPTGPINPLEHLVRTISRLVDQFNTPSSHSQLLVPLGVLRVLQATVNKQVLLVLPSRLFDLLICPHVSWTDHTSSGGSMSSTHSMD
jgi:hypothetical protein